MAAGAFSKSEYQPGTRLPLRERVTADLDQAFTDPEIAAAEDISVGCQEGAEDASFQSILRELAYAEMVRRGLADSDAGRTVPDAEFRRRISSWQT